MAFSTQKEFFHVPFRNEKIDFECRRECVKLKSYDSTIDTRSWAYNDKIQSRFVYDLVVCNTPGFGRSPDGEPASSTYGRYGNLIVGDSLINTANATLSRMEKLLPNQKTRSGQGPPTDKEDSPEIKRIMQQRYNPEEGKNFERKIKELADKGKLDKNDVNELMRMRNTIENMNKAYNILQAENATLKRLIEKQALRCNALQSIHVDPERSNDNAYLQKKVDELRKEVIALRKKEDEMMKGKKSNDYAPEVDINDLKAVINERNKLREKCKQLEGLEDKMTNLQHQNREATNRRDDDLNNQAKYIDNIETELQGMQKFYEGEFEKTKFNEELLKCRCNELKEELMQSQCQAHRADCLQMEIDVLRNELRKRDIALNAYECQYQQLLHKAKAFKNNGYRFVDDLPENELDGIIETDEQEEEEE